MSGVKARNTRESLCATNTRLLMRWAGLSMCTFCALGVLDIMGGAQHAQTFNFWTAIVMMTSNSPPSKRVTKEDVEVENLYIIIMEYGTKGGYH